MEGERIDSGHGSKKTGIASQQENLKDKGG